MKRILFTLLFSFSLGATQAQDLIVGTFNIRLETSRDTGHLWSERADKVANLIRFHDFDVLGTQEGLPNQLGDLDKLLPHYQRYGIGRDDGHEAGEHAAIFFKKDRFELLDHGDFWLSETPDQPSLGWDAICCNRICSWVQLKDKKTKKKFYFFNAHYDHQGETARKESSKLILEKIKSIARTHPVIFTGDLNCDSVSAPYDLLANSGLIQDSFSQVDNPYAYGGSFTGFKTFSDGNSIIDHVFISNAFTAKKWGLLTDSYFGKYPSDHFPVLVVLNIK